MKQTTLRIEANILSKIDLIAEKYNSTRADILRFAINYFLEKNNNKKELEELKKIQEETNSNVKQLLGSMPIILDKILEQNLKTGHLIYQLFFKEKPEKFKKYKEDLKEALEREKEKTIAEIEKLIGEL